MANNSQEQAQHYRDLVEQYETVGEAIQSLIRANGGHTEKMSPSDMQRYRQLAQERDDLYNQIKAIEAAWFVDD